MSGTSNGTTPPGGVGNPPEAEGDRDTGGGVGSGGSQGHFPAGLVGLALAAVATTSGLLVARSNAERGVFLALTTAALACGGLAGFLVGGPGLGSGDGATDDANEKGWASRLGVFGNWVTGAAFVLVTANAAKIANWFADFTRSIGVADGGTAQDNRAYQYALGACMIAALGMGFALGFMQMVTNGRSVISRTEAEAVAALKQAAAEVASSAAESQRAAEEAATAATAATEAMDEVRSLVVPMTGR